MARRVSKLTHLDAANRPTMVDVGGKQGIADESRGVRIFARITKKDGTWAGVSAGHRDDSKETARSRDARENR